MLEQKAQDTQAFMCNTLQKLEHFKILAGLAANTHSEVA